MARLLFPPLPMVCLLPALLSSAGVRVHVKEDSAGDNMVEVLRFLPQLEMRPPSISPNPVESRDGFVPLTRGWGVGRVQEPAGVSRRPRTVSEAATPRPAGRQQRDRAPWGALSPVRGPGATLGYNFYIILDCEAVMEYLRGNIFRSYKTMVFDHRVGDMTSICSNSNSQPLSSPHH